MRIRCAGFGPSVSPTIRDSGSQRALDGDRGRDRPPPAAWIWRKSVAPRWTVAVIDTGITQHPSSRAASFLATRLHQRSRLGQRWQWTRQPCIDPGDNTGDVGECGDGAPGESSSWHGTFVSGLIAANTGQRRTALPAWLETRGSQAGVSARPLWRTFDDVAAATLWGSGRAGVAGAPLEPESGAGDQPEPRGPVVLPAGGSDAINVALAQGSRGHTLPGQ